jgi:hypothetical protein
MEREKIELTVEQKIKVISGLIVGFLFIWLFFIPSCDGEKLLSEKYTKSNALIDSRQFVEKRLKSPSTADFSSETQNNVKKVNDSTFVVTGYVDSQNSFGALIRTNYSCKITYLDAIGKVQCDNLIIE